METNSAPSHLAVYTHVPVQHPMSFQLYLIPCVTLYIFMIVSQSLCDIPCPDGCISVPVKHVLMVTSESLWIICVMLVTSQFLCYSPCLDGYISVPVLQSMSWWLHLSPCVTVHVLVFSFPSIADSILGHVGLCWKEVSWEFGQTSPTLSPWSDFQMSYTCPSLHWRPCLPHFVWRSIRDIGYTHNKKQCVLTHRTPSLHDPNLLTLPPPPPTPPNPSVSLPIIPSTYQSDMCSLWHQISTLGRGSNENRCRTHWVPHVLTLWHCKHNTTVTDTASVWYK